MSATRTSRFEGRTRMKDSPGHTWEFKARFRRNAFGWRSQPAIQRVKQAVREIKKAARSDRVLAGEGAVLFLERVSPALEHVDGSSGVIGTAVNRAIEELVTIIASAPADHGVRESWLERLFAAHEADQMPYIETLAEYWGDLCASPTLASAWADRLLEVTRLALSPDRKVRGVFHGTSACLSALYRSERYAEIVQLLEVDTLRDYKQWAVKALAASGRKADAIRYAESCRGPWTNDGAVDAACEEILLSSGLAVDAYERYAFRASQRGTYVAMFRAVVAKYPDKAPRDILADLAKATPGAEGKWFAAARDAGLLDLALDFAHRSPTDPRTLTRAAHDLAEDEPAFAAEAGLLALQWLTQGYGYEVTGSDVKAAYAATMKAAARHGNAEAIQRRIHALVVGSGPCAGFVRQVLGRVLGIV